MPDADESLSPEQRWGTGLDLTKDGDNPTSLKEYVQWRTSYYNQKKEWTVAHVSDAFAADFEGWEKETFDKCESTDILRQLRDTLRNCGIYVKMQRGFAISRALAEVVEEDIPWPTNEAQPPPNEQPTSPERQPQPPHPPPPTMQPPTMQPPMTMMANREPSREGRTQPTKYQELQARQHTYGRELNMLAKLLHADDLYSGEPQESFDYKYMIFLDHTRRAGLPGGETQLAFPMFLKGLARDFYYKRCRWMPIAQAIEGIKKRFETDERTRHLIQEWEKASLQSYLSQGNKTTRQALDELVKELSTLQQSLPEAYQPDSIMRDKLLMACRVVDACQFACFKPAPTVTGLIADLQASIAMTEERQGKEMQSKETTMYYTDRRYHGQLQPYRRRPPGPKQPYSSQRHRRQQRRCYVCRKLECWSTNHTEKERQEAKQRIQDRVSQLLQDDDGDEEAEDIGEEDTEEVDALILDFPSLDTNEPELPTQYAESYCTLTSAISVSVTEAENMVQDLANAATRHALIHDRPTHPTTYLTVKPPAVDDRPKRYPDTRFFGIMVDSGAAARSTAGLDQFRAILFIFFSWFLPSVCSCLRQWCLPKATSIGNSVT